MIDSSYSILLNVNPFEMCSWITVRPTTHFWRMDLTCISEIVHPYIYLIIVPWSHQYGLLIIWDMWIVGSCILSNNCSLYRNRINLYNCNSNLQRSIQIRTSSLTQIQSNWEQIRKQSATAGEPVPYPNTIATIPEMVHLLYFSSRTPPTLPPPPPLQTN